MEARLPLRAAGEDEVTRREFARFLVLGAGALAVGNVGLAVWTPLRSINTGSPRPIVALDAVPVGDPTSSTTRPAPTRRSCYGSPIARWWRSARSARTWVASSTTRPTRTLALPVPRGQLRRPHRRGHLGTADPTLGRIDVEVRDDGMIWALGRPE